MVNLDIPDNGKLVVSNFAIYVALITPWWLTYLIVYALCYGALEADEADWMSDNFIPALEESMKDVTISFVNVKDIYNRTSGFLLKMVFAFFFQEYFMYLPAAYDNFGLSFGAALG